jgi:outer membrane protein OmpA-like peptidoglycan-associated protein
MSIIYPCVKNVFALLLFMVISGHAMTQDLLGLTTSNYSGLSAIDLNPGNIADNRLKLEIQLTGLGFGVANNFIGFNPKYLVRDGGITSSSYPLLTPTPPTDQFTNAYFQDNRQTAVYANAYLPGLLMAIDKKSAFTLSGRIRSYVNVDGVDGELFKLSYNSLKTPELWNITNTNANLSIQTMSWLEIAAGYGRVVLNDKEHFIKIGARLKGLKGLQSAYLYSDELKYQVTSDSTISIIDSKFNYGHSSNFEATDGNVSFRGISKFGLGLDLGVVYEWRPDYADYIYEMDGRSNLSRNDQNKYRLKVAASLTDVGGIRFIKGGSSSDFNANVTNWDISKLDFGTNPIAALDDTLRNRFKSTNAGESYKMNLPTAFSTQIDYHVWKGFYVNQTNYLAFGFKSNPNKVHDFTTVSITPRWENKIVGVFIPITYNSLIGMRTGMGLRLGPISIGTSSVYPYSAFLKADGSGTKEIRGIDGYVMLKIPIAFKKTKDRDDDKVSDKLDQCEKVPGVWALRGCPDRDGDGLGDGEDQCPDVAGTKELHGCPDRDLDGITDLKDDCPDDKGLAAFNGCPDRDGDGVMDRTDDCPDDKGLVAFNGCPDRDADGIMDRVDDCPDEKGLAAFNGCPDKDGDAIADKFDACPDVFGVAELKGCPQPVLAHYAENTVVESVSRAADMFSYSQNIDKNTSKFKLSGYGIDTVKTVLVSSPSMRAKNAYLEADGFFRFAKEAEAVVLKAEEKEVIKSAFDNLEYETNKAIIVETSFASLNELADLMVKYPSWKLRISGHTDNVGKRAANLDLSKRRSESVKKFLMQRGLSEDRFEIFYFGPDKPIATNDTNEGRARNRRVEMLIIE